MAINKDEKTAVLSFRGTQLEKEYKLETIIDCLSDGMAMFYKGDNGEKTHLGFLTAYEQVKDEINAELSRLGEYALYITGHSLGGAVAVVATKDINTDNIAACYTYGSPKVGNEEFDDDIKSPIYRVINEVDLVPFLPFTSIFTIFIFLLSKILKKYKKITKLFEILAKGKEYCHHGDVRYFFGKENGEIEQKTNLAGGEMQNSILLIWKTILKPSSGIDCHDLGEYINKLAEYAKQRN